MNYEKKYEVLRRLYEAKKEECNTLKYENQQLRKTMGDMSDAASAAEKYEKELRANIETLKKLREEYRRQVRDAIALKAEYKHRMESLLKQMKQ